MSHLDSNSLRFAASFVDAVTIGPFFADLKRIKQQETRFATLRRRRDEEMEVATDAAA